MHAYLLTFMTSQIVCTLIVKGEKMEDGNLLGIKVYNGQVYLGKARMVNGVLNKHTDPASQTHTQPSGLCACSLGCRY